jgi:hypothetical protein
MGITALAAVVVGCNQSYPAMDSITDEDLLRDVTALAHDDFRGREAGTVDELRAAAWVAERAREAGLLPVLSNAHHSAFAHEPDLDRRKFIRHRN